MVGRLPTAGLVIVSAIALFACTRARNVDLVRAEEAYRAASTDPLVTRYAAARLHDAEQSLRSAQREWADDHDDEEMQHMGYVVERQVEIARVTAQKEAAKRETTRLQGTVTEEVLRARERELAVLRRALTTIQSRTTERGIVLTIPDVLFEVDKADLKPGAQRELYSIASYLKDHPEQRLLIEGHTDSTGTDAYNRDLSLRRATAVETFLLRSGIAADRFHVRGLGESSPIASNDSAAGRQQNRRVEIVMLDAGSPAADVRREERVIEYRVR